MFQDIVSKSIPKKTHWDNALIALCLVASDYGFTVVVPLK